MIKISNQTQYVYKKTYEYRTNTINSNLFCTIAKVKE